MPFIRGTRFIHRDLQEDKGSWEPVLEVIEPSSEGGGHPYELTSSCRQVWSPIV